MFWNRWIRWFCSGEVEDGKEDILGGVRFKNSFIVWSFSRVIGRGYLKNRLWYLYVVSGCGGFVVVSLIGVRAGVGDWFCWSVLLWIRVELWSADVGLCRRWGVLRLRCFFVFSILMRVLVLLWWRWMYFFIFGVFLLLFVVMGLNCLLNCVWVSEVFGCDLFWRLIG